MKVVIRSLDIQLDGPTDGYLNVYAAPDANGRLRYVTGRKAYASINEASRTIRVD